MFNKFSSRIILAWIVLGLAMILLTLSVSFSQSVSIIRKDKGEVKFKYKSTDKKNSQDIDTTFTAKNDAEFYSIMQDISDRHDLKLSILENRDFGQKDDFADIHVEINRSMKELEADMKELEASMANMKFDFQFDSDENDDDNEMEIRIHSNQPPPPPSPSAPATPGIPSVPPPPSIDRTTDCMQISIDKNGKQTRIFKKYDHNELNIPDSLDNADHVIVFGDKGEKAPELETVISDENGRQVFIYKRKK